MIKNSEFGNLHLNPVVKSCKACDLGCNQHRVSAPACPLEKNANMPHEIIGTKRNNMCNMPITLHSAKFFPNFLIYLVLV